MPTVDRAALLEEIVADGRADLFGLYEVIWALNARYPALSNSEKLVAARSAVTELLNRDAIAIHRVTWHPRIAVPIQKQAALELLKNAQTWAPPAKDASGIYYGYLSDASDSHTGAV